MAILNQIRKRKIRKTAFNGKTGMKPLSAIKRAIVLLDAENADFEECHRKAGKFFAAHKIDLKLFYIDFRKMGRDEIITTCIQTTLTRKRTNLLGLPDAGYMSEVKSCGYVADETAKGTTSGRTDQDHENPRNTANEILFVSLVDSDCPAVRMIASAMPAGFKVGICDYSGSPYNMVVIKHGNTDSNRNHSAISNEVSGSNRDHSVMSNEVSGSNRNHSAISNEVSGSKASSDNGILATFEAICKNLEQIV